MKLTRRTAVGALGAIGLAGCLGDDGSDSAVDTGSIGDSEGASEGETETEGTQWFDAPLEDVLTGGSFRLSEFDQPVLIHLFAIWCSKCDAQESEVDQLRASNDEFAVVSINADPNEDAEAVREHAERNDYDWQWVTPPSDVIESFVGEFGTSVTHPPSVPMVLLCPDGSFRRLSGGVRSPETLQSALDSC